MVLYLFRATGSQTDEDAVSQIARASDDLNTLVQQVGSFVDWWHNMNMSLANLETILPHVRLDRTSLFRSQSVTSRWIEVHQRFVLYQRMVSLI